ncbi:MAG: site-specific integrase [Nocardioidaceae bacterium]
MAFNDNGKATKYHAVAQFRGYDGRVRQVRRARRTQASAENALRLALQEMAALSAHPGGLAPTNRFQDAAQLWIQKVQAMVDEGRRSPGTLDTYEAVLNRNVLPALGMLRLAEVTTPAVDAFVGKIRRQKGAPTAKLCRSIVSGVMGFAVRQGAVRANPARDVERIESDQKSPPRALTAIERADFLALLRSDEFAVRHDLPDLAVFMLATGARIGEALAVVWAEIDLEDGVVDLSSTIIRIKGKGLLRKRTKSAAGQRVLALPPWAVAMLRHRFMMGVRLDQPVFPDTLSGFRDPNNTLRALRKARGQDQALGWVKSHNLRKTTATILDEAGLSARAVADQLGHSRPSMTQDVYLGRRVKAPEAAAALEQALTDAMDEKRE